MHPAPLTCYICPICKAALQLKPSADSYACPNNHHFDIAKEGYLNLLPVQYKGSAEPGDNKLMMQARREFLDAGYYQAMAHAAAAVIGALRPGRLLDLGCGEGYYSRQIAAACAETIELHGIDIAKFAVRAAAKIQANARFIVAGVNRLPYACEYFDCVLRVFAPSNDDELTRILKPGGHLLTVTPGPRHLWQLKEFIYSEVKEHALESHPPQGFERISTQRLAYLITPSPEQRIALLQMTPFAWKASASVQQAIKDAPALEIETDFVLTLSQRLPCLPE